MTDANMAWLIPGTAGTWSASYTSPSVHAYQINLGIDSIETIAEVMGIGSSVIRIALETADNPPADPADQPAPVDKKATKKAKT